MQTKVVIFVLTYNRVNYLKSALESILNQTYSDFILNVLDNCSNDGTEEYVKSIEDKRVNYIRHEHNLGGIGNISYAFKNCAGDYFAVFHDDDILHDNLLKEEVAYLENHEDCMAVSCLANNIDENGEYTKIINEEKYDERIFCHEQFFHEYLNKQKSFTFPATVYITEFIKNNNITILSTPGPCIDVVIYMELEKKGGTIAEIPKTLLDYRIYKSQDSSSNLEEMLIKLIHFLSNDEYYGNLLTEDELGRTKYFKWYFRRLLARQTSKCISYKKAVRYLEKMHQELKVSKISTIKYERMLRIADIFSVPASLAYKLTKKVKK